jgi:hypothetical protein
MDEIFDSAVRPSGDLAGVFECDEETSYFYLYETGDDGDAGAGRILDSVHVFTGTPDFVQDDIAVRWSADERKVGLFIRGELAAVFDCSSGAKYGARYRPGERPTLPPEALEGF